MKDDGYLLSGMKPGQTDSSTATRVNAVSSCETVQTVTTTATHDLGTTSPDSWETQSVSSFGSTCDEDVPLTTVEESHTRESRGLSKDHVQRSLFNEVRSLALSIHSELDKNRNSSEGKQRRKSAQVEQQRRLSANDVHIHDLMDMLSPSLKSPGRRKSL